MSVPGAGGGFQTHVVAPLVIDGEIARDPEDPHAPLVVGGRDGLGAGDPQEHVLGQVAGRLRLAHGPAQIPEQPWLVGREERFGVGDGSHLPIRTDEGADRRTDVEGEGRLANRPYSVTQRRFAAAFSIASRTRWFLTPSSKFGSGTLPSAIASSRS